MKLELGNRMALSLGFPVSMTAFTTLSKRSEFPSKSFLFSEKETENKKRSYGFSL